MKSCVLEVRELGKAYHRRNALKNLDLTLPPGEVFGLIGLNGAGKTTLIKCILDVQRPDRGTVTLGGLPARRARSRAMLAYLPERFALPDYMTGRRYLQYINDTHLDGRLGGGELERRARELCREMDLEDAALAFSVRAYSKGMLQKLGLVGCLLSDKSLLLLDEPSSGLDPKARVLFRQAVERLHSEGRTIFLSTHVLNDIERLCDRVGVLHEGELRFLGTPGECMDCYGVGDLETAFLKCIEAQ